MVAELLKRTPLYNRHLAAGARMGSFAGWEMPVSYSGILEEHRAVRASAGLFDISHMGVVELRGPDAGAACQELTTNDVRRLGDGQGQYSLLCNEQGGVIDDVIVYRLASERYLLCLNAANTDGDVAWIREHACSGVEVVNRSVETALLALQGPRAEDLLAPHSSAEVWQLRPFGCLEARVAGAPTIVARTGYTGGDGFELFVPADAVGGLWDALLSGGRVVLPAGLGARDTLRLEAGLLLHGEDMGPMTSALEASLGWVVKLDAGPFIGREALAAEARQGPARRLVRLVLMGSGVPRRGCEISREGQKIGVVTSGTMSPMLRKGIALGSVESPHHRVGTRVAVRIRGRAVDAEIIRGPFYSQRTSHPRSFEDRSVVVGPS